MTDAERRIVLTVSCVLALGAGVKAFRGDGVPAAAPAPRSAAAGERARDSTVHRTPSPPAPQGTVDINAADAAALMTLPGIGPAKAKAIIEERARRRFRAVSDLLRVKGIGPATLRRLRPLVRIGQNATPGSPATLPRAPARR